MQNFGIDINSLYLYDASGERVWKLTGPEMQMQINAHTVITSVELEKTLYVNPLLVMTEEEYTKHYYVEGERICSKIGGGFGVAGQNPVGPHLSCIEGSLSHISYNLKEFVNNSLQCASYDGSWSIKDRLYPAYNNHNEFENSQFFYHSDHLGSSSFVTNIEGSAEQHIQYLPYGELFVSQRNSDFNSRYKFTAKELDNETNYTYFGARYYDSDLSVWLSVDPLADERSWVSPYNYVQNSPVMRVDPSGTLDVEDGYTVDKNGCTERVDNTGGDNFDVLYSKENYDKGLRNYDDYGDDETGIIVEKGVLNNKRTVEGSVNGELVEVDLYSVNGDKTAKEFFEYLGDNTNVEWGHTYVGLPKDEQSWIGTTHLKSKDASHDVVNRMWKYSVRGHVHSHPYDYYPSKSDKLMSGNLLKQYGKEIPTQIYFKGAYYNYNSKTSNIDMDIQYFNRKTGGGGLAPNKSDNLIYDFKSNKIFS